MRQWITQKGAFLQTPLLLEKAIKGKKIEPLKMKAAIMYLFSIICVAYNCMHIYEIFPFSLNKVKKTLLLFFPPNKCGWDGRLVH